MLLRFGAQPEQHSSKQHLHGAALYENYSFEGMLHGFSEKAVNVKVGVLGLENRSPDEIWLEFDPTNKAIATHNRLLLPFVVTARSDVSTVDFFIHKEMKGCSGALRPSGLHARSTFQRYQMHARKSCEIFAATRPKDEWFKWDVPAKGSFADLSGGAGLANGACFKCQDPSEISRVARFPAVSLNRVLSDLQPKSIPYLDIDAQGMDVAMVLSLHPKVLRKVSRIKIECQEPDEGLWPQSMLPIWIYENQSGIANHCTRAQRFLEDFGFRKEKLQVNYCACAEFNLYMSRL